MGTCTASTVYSKKCVLHALYIQNRWYEGSNPIYLHEYTRTHVHTWVGCMWCVINVCMHVFSKEPNTFQKQPVQSRVQQCLVTPPSLCGAPGRAACVRGASAELAYLHFVFKYSIRLPYTSGDYTIYLQIYSVRLHIYCSRLKFV